MIPYWISASKGTPIVSVGGGEGDIRSSLAVKVVLRSCGGEAGGLDGDSGVVLIRAGGTSDKDDVGLALATVQGMAAVRATLK